jgi:sterol desaturase/sphingolipid hydroxylase (fatty acid hydroxylase superfamily)
VAVHLVHHVDRDLDASTALRFHAGELALSIPWRAMQIAAIGVPPDALRLWQNIVLLSILFHHSNVELPITVSGRGSLRRDAASSRHSPFQRP